MQEVHAALLGLSHPHSLAHLRTLQAVPEVAGITLWDEDEALLQATVESQGEKISGTTTDLASVLGRQQILFVVGALRNDLGPPIFIRALEAGKHVITDKPIGKTAVESAQVAAVAKRERRKLGVFYQNRSLPPIQDARRIVEQGLIGDLVSVEMRMVTTQVQVRNPRHWLFNQDKAGGGILSWLGCHYIDQILNITQDEIVSVARAGRNAQRRGYRRGGRSRPVPSFRLRRGRHASRRLHAVHERGRLSQRRRLRHLRRRERPAWDASPGAPMARRAPSMSRAPIPAGRRRPNAHLTTRFGDSPAYGGRLRRDLPACL